ncbi:MAG TPA: hypothetical protein VMO00_18595, partial [Methylomirabilota bacterium]|nr:hypothetical protein [Methylomirabilota bacterium]
RARLLAARSNAQTLDWVGFIEEFSQRVLIEERNGQSAINLRDVPRPQADDMLSVHGIALPARHPTIIFGDGGSAKSYTALYLAGELANMGKSIAYFDWEFAQDDHRDRLERLFGIGMPKIIYARCEHALVYEMDRLRRIVRDEKIDYVVYDSIVFACDGPPEAAENAGRYFRAVRQIGPGSLHVAHVTKGENGDQKPFGSVFWHNGARATWYAKLLEDPTNERQIKIGFFNRKSNMGRLSPPVGFKVEFTKDRTYFAKDEPTDNPDMAIALPIKQRLIHALKHGSMSFKDIAENLGEKYNTVHKIISRDKRTFVVVGKEVGLLQQDSAK